MNRLNNVDYSKTFNVATAWSVSYCSYKQQWLLRTAFLFLNRILAGEFCLFLKKCLLDPRRSLVWDLEVNLLFEFLELITVV